MLVQLMQNNRMIVISVLQTGVKNFCKILMVMNFCKVLMLYEKYFNIAEYFITFYIEVFSHILCF